MSACRPLFPALALLLLTAPVSAQTDGGRPATPPRDSAARPADPGQPPAAGRERPDNARQTPETRTSETRNPGETQNPDACENRAQASTGILDLVDKLIAGIVTGTMRAEAVSAGMKRLESASERLNKEDVQGACAIVRSVRNRYRLTRNR